MSDHFAYRIASESDEAQLRALMARNPIPGAIEVIYSREPNYFWGCDIMGDRVEVGVCHKNDDEIVGIAQRSSRLMYYNGVQERIGYLSQLRLDKRYWGQGLTREGFRYGKQLHAQGDVRGYITTIIELNKRARAILETPREPFPHYHDIGRVYTLALMVRKPKPASPIPSGVTISRGENVAEIIEFLNRVGCQRQFFYHYTEDDFSNGRLRDLRLDDVIIAKRDNKIIGTLAYWNQMNFKQTIISGYTRGLAFAKPFYNTYLRIMGAKPLPSAGEKLVHSYATLLCVESDDTQIFEVLLAQVYEIAYQRGDAYLMIGLHADDPLLSVAQSIRHVTYRSRLYAVTWVGEDTHFHDQLDKRIPHIEIATL